MSEIVLTEEQSRAVALCATRLKKGMPLTTLFGFAGTGKTEVARHIAEAVGGRTVFCAPTGKAALVLKKRGIAASTVHQLIYRPVGASMKKLEELQAEFERTKKPARKEELKAQITDLLALLDQPRFILEEEALEGVDAVVLDESSMVGTQMLEDLMSFGVPVLALGDPAQLPPVNASSPIAGDGYRPTVMLDKLHRFALDSPINYFATRCRESGPRAVTGWRQGCGINEVATFDLDARQVDLLIERFDQVICGRNATRWRLNARIREAKGLPADELDDADIMVCLRNDYKLGLVNGEQYTVAQLAEMSIPENRIVSVEGWVGERDKPHFAFGYAITCHKAQGSEWDRVAILDESNVFHSAARQWLYTAITRAAEKVVVLRCA